MSSSARQNRFGQPIGADLGGWRSPPYPDPEPLVGNRVRLEPLRRSHAGGLFPAFEASPPSMWTYLPFGPFPDAEDLGDQLERLISLRDWQPFAIVVDDEPVGFCSYLRIDPAGGVIEIGSIAFAASLQRTSAATEAIFLLLGRAFALGYRRVEWKCDDLNAPSMAAARRLGFSYEGTFRKATHYRGRSRDTAWFAMLDDEWPAIEHSFLAWLSPTNFDVDGRQRRSLASLRSAT